MDFQKQSDCLCMRSGCTNLYKFMLRGKNKAFCSTCTAIFYFDTNIGHPAGTTIREKTEIVDILQVLDETLKIMKEDGELLGLQEFYYDYFSDLRNFEAKSASLYKRISFCDFKTDFDEGLNLFETAFRTLCAVRVSQMAVTRNNYKLSLELSQRVTGQKTEVKSTDQSFENLNNKSAKFENELEVQKLLVKKLYQINSDQNDKICSLVNKSNSYSYRIEKLEDIVKSYSLGILNLYQTKLGLKQEYSDGQQNNSDPLDINKFCFELDLCVQEHVEILEITKHFKLPDILGIAVTNFDPKDPSLAEFLICSVPENLQQFFIGKFGLWYANDLLTGLTNVFSCTQEVIINRCYLTANNFESIIDSAVSTKKITFDVCKLQFDKDMSFSAKEYKLKYISFSNTKTIFSASPDGQTDQFEVFIKAIANSKLKDSLETINLFECDCDMNKVFKTLQKYNLSNINIESEIFVADS